MQVEGQTKWTPCSPGDPQAVEKSWTELDGDELLEPPLRVRDFVKAIKSSRPTVSGDDLTKNAEWTKEFGSEGAYMAGKEGPLCYCFIPNERTEGDWRCKGPFKHHDNLRRIFLPRKPNRERLTLRLCDMTQLHWCSTRLSTGGVVTVCRFS